MRYDPEMSAEKFCLFETPLGCCAIVWHAGGILGVQLAEINEAATRARLRRRFPAATLHAPESRIETAIDGIVRLLGGERIDLTGLELDMTAVSPFERAVYEAARGIPAGQIVTYGAIAKMVATRRPPGAAAGRAGSASSGPAATGCDGDAADRRAAGTGTAAGPDGTGAAEGHAGRCDGDAADRRATGTGKAAGPDGTGAAEGHAGRCDGDAADRRAAGTGTAGATELLRGRRRSATRQSDPDRAEDSGFSDPIGARAVGRALGANPWAIIIPCHRVVAAGGKLGGFSANGGRITKRRLLEIEKARPGGEPDLFDVDAPLLG